MYVLWLSSFIIAIAIAYLEGCFYRFCFLLCNKAMNLASSLFRELYNSTLMYLNRKWLNLIGRKFSDVFVAGKHKYIALIWQCNEFDPLKVFVCWEGCQIMSLSASHLSKKVIIINNLLFWISYILSDKTTQTWNIRSLCLCQHSYKAKFNLKFEA